MPQVADTGFLVAYGSKADAHYRWTRDLSGTAPLRTCEAVWTVGAYLLGASEPLLQRLVDSDLTEDFHAETHAADLLFWQDKFADLDHDFANSSVVKHGERHPGTAILTTDHGDFAPPARSRKNLCAACFPRCE